MNRREFLKLGLAVAALPAVAKFAPPIARPGAEIRVGNRVFKAWGDGRHNDGPTIQRAIDAAAGETVHFPTGTYKITSPLLVRDARVVLDDATWHVPRAEGVWIENSTFDAQRSSRSVFTISMP